MRCELFGLPASKRVLCLRGYMEFVKEAQVLILGTGLSQIDSRDPGGYGRYDFIADGVKRGSNFIDGYNLTALLPEDNHLVPHLDVIDVAYVEHRQIHADTADNRRPAPVNQHVAAGRQQAVQSVGITDGDCRNCGRLGSLVGIAVADLEAGGNFFEMNYACL